MSYLGIYIEKRKGFKDRGTIYLNDDTHGWKEFSYSPPKYYKDDDGEYQTLFGENCSSIEGKYDWEDPNVLEKDVPKETAVLRDLYYKNDDVPNNHRIAFLDIEIELIGTLTPSYIQMAPAELTSISILDDKTDLKYCFIVDKKKTLKDIKSDNKIIIPCLSEKDLISRFLKQWKKINPTIVVTWNGAYFDIPYLYFRIRNVYGESTSSMLSPIKKITSSITNFDNPVQIGGVNHLDLMLLTKKYITKEEPSYKLGDIGIKYAKMGKIEYDGNLDQLFESNPLKYADYNVRDVEILKELEKNLQFVRLTILICHLCHVPYESIYYNTILNEGAILTYLKRKEKVANNKPTTYNPSIREIEIGDPVKNQRNTPTVEGVISSIEGEYCTVLLKSGETRTRLLRTIKKTESYAGGFLLDIKPGVWKWCSDYDYSSLYPSIIRTLNLGIETLVGRIDIEDYTKNIWWSLKDLKEKDPNEVVGFMIFDKKTYTESRKSITIGKLIEAIESKKWIVSANGVCFRSDKKSIVAEILADWFRLRQEYKNLMKKASKEGDKVLEELYDRQQHSLKILLNAVYGAFSVNSWRFTDGHKILSSAITCSGQRLTIESILELNIIIDKKYMN